MTRGLPRNKKAGLKQDKPGGPKRPPTLQELEEQALLYLQGELQILTASAGNTKEVMNVLKALKAIEQSQQRATPPADDIRSRFAFLDSTDQEPPG